MGGQHRGSGRRGISTSVIILTLSVALIALATVGWFQLRDRIDNQATAAAETCVEGDAVLNVAADPLIAPALAAIASRWTTETPRIIRDHCVTAQVTATDSVPAATALNTGTWDDALGPAPSLWIPVDSRIGLRAPEALDGQPRPLATSPLVLAVPTDLGRALTGGSVRWQDLPALQSDPTAMDELGLTMWGSLGIALPTGARTHPTTMALEAVAADTAGIGTGPLTIDLAESMPVTETVSSLAIGANSLGATAGPTTADALAALAARPDTSSAVHAVPVIEQQLLHTLDEQHIGTLTGYLPQGAAPVADFPAAVLDAPWIDETLSRAAAEFTDYVRQPDQAALLVDYGFRAGDQRPQASGDLPLPRVDAVLEPAPAEVAGVLLDTRIRPLIARKITMLVDTSESMATPAGSGTRLSATADALRTTIARVPGSSVVGMYVFADTGSGYREAVGRDGLTESKRAALSTALDDVTLTDDDPVLPALAAAYRDAVDNYDPSRPNSVLAVIDSTGPAAGTELRDALDDLLSPDTPVRLDIILLTEPGDTSELQRAADRTGGTVTVVDPSDSASLTDLLRKLAS